MYMYVYAFICLYINVYIGMCCDSCSTVVSLPVPTCALQKKRANALHMEEYAMTNNDDGSYRLLSRPP